MIRVFLAILAAAWVAGCSTPKPPPKNIDTIPGDFEDPTAGDPA